jgi:hypothetical protein
VDDKNEALIIFLFLTPAELDAYELHRNLDRHFPSYNTIADIICTKTNEEITELKNAYKTLYAKELKKDVAKKFGYKVYGR